MGIIDDAIGGWMRNAEATKELETNKLKHQKLDLDDYFKSPSDTRVGYRMLKDAGFAPPQVDMMRQINELKAKIQQADCEKTKTKLKLELMDMELRKNLGSR
ncbi:DnaJ family domain-containing protein [Paraferrimonas sedimenticola]|uniref:DnaJ homologue subfamily C member 28 conserved domain-containing protein n=1 Tax=Paraferrimonas sedimenticola TaxID=375674 RepID=A0AA37RW62_9GAMM|nr:DnaJ family domain-containing protein [Paraferrimonas sedimenticola]GLP96074.1 hypothetical protein GCM10007895_13800 [Paraferrimonas sedimenticola]